MTPTVYVVLWCDGEDKNLVGVFSSAEALREHLPKNEHWSSNTALDTLEGMSVGEMWYRDGAYDWGQYRIHLVAIDSVVEP